MVGTIHADEKTGIPSGNIGHKGSYREFVSIPPVTNVLHKAHLAARSAFEAEAQEHIGERDQLCGQRCCVVTRGRWQGKTHEEQEKLSFIDGNPTICIFLNLFTWFYLSFFLIFSMVHPDQLSFSCDEY